MTNTISQDNYCYNLWQQLIQEIQVVPKSGVDNTSWPLGAWKTLQSTSTTSLVHPLVEEGQWARSHFLKSHRTAGRICSFHGDPVQNILYLAISTWPQVLLEEKRMGCAVQNELKAEEFNQVLLKGRSTLKRQKTQQMTDLKHDRFAGRIGTHHMTQTQKKTF